MVRHTVKKVSGGGRQRVAEMTPTTLASMLPTLAYLSTIVPDPILNNRVSTTSITSTPIICAASAAPSGAASIRPGAASIRPGATTATMAAGPARNLQLNEPGSRINITQNVTIPAANDTQDVSHSREGALREPVDDQQQMHVLLHPDSEFAPAFHIADGGDAGIHSDVTDVDMEMLVKSIERSLKEEGELLLSKTNKNKNKSAASSSGCQGGRRDRGNASTSQRSFVSLVTSDDSESEFIIKKPKVDVKTKAKMSKNSRKTKFTSAPSSSGSCKRKVVVNSTPDFSDAPNHIIRNIIDLKTDLPAPLTPIRDEFAPVFAKSEIKKKVQVSGSAKKSSAVNLQPPLSGNTTLEQPGSSRVVTPPPSTTTQNPSDSDSALRVVPKHGSNATGEPDSPVAVMSRLPAPPTQGPSDSESDFEFLSQEDRDEMRAVIRTYSRLQTKYRAKHEANIDSCHNDDQLENAANALIHKAEQTIIEARLTLAGINNRRVAMARSRAALEGIEKKINKLRRGT